MTKRVKIFSRGYSPDYDSIVVEKPIITFKRVILKCYATQQQFGPIRPFKGLFANKVFFIQMQQSD
jgi:hypothetical protein